LKGRIGDDTENRGYAQDNNQPQPSIFESLNQRLLASGFPRFDLGQYKIEPIVTVGFILAFMLLGFRGLLFGALLFAIVNMSNSSNNGGLTQFFSSFFNTNDRQNNNRPNAGRNLRR
jgi:hypothetical protein